MIYTLCNTLLNLMKIRLGRSPVFRCNQTDEQALGAASAAVLHERYKN
jgi:hypothetical protein